MEHPVPSYIPLLIVALLAFAVPILTARFERVRVPVVVGEILAGMLLGKAGFGLIDDPGPVLTFLSDFGLAYLMFLSGLELDLAGMVPRARGALRPGWRQWLTSPLVLAGSAFALTLAGALWVTHALVAVGLLSSPWLAGLILSTCALGVVLPILKERGLAATEYGQTLLAYASIADFATMVLVALYVAVRGGGRTQDILLVLLLFVAFLVLYRGSAHLSRRPLIRRLLEAATGQFDVRASLALVLVFIALADQLGVESILGAFLAGMIVSLVTRGEGELLRAKLDAIGYGFFVPIFFILFGARFDLWAAAGSGRTWLLIPAFLLVAYMTKVLPTLLFGVRFPWRQTLGGGVLVAAQLSLTIAAADIGQRLGVFDPATVSAFLLMAIATTVISPLLFGRLVRDEAIAGQDVIVAGDSELAALLARRLAGTGQAVTLLAAGPLRQQEYPAAVRLRPAGDDPKAALQSAGAAKARTVAVLFDDSRTNAEWASLTRRHFGVENVVTCVDDHHLGAALGDAGIHVIHRALAALSLLEIAVRAPQAMEWMTGREEAVNLVEAIVLNPAVHGRPLKAAGLPPGNLAIALRRGSERLLPNGDTALRLGDRVTLVGRQQDLREAVSYLQHTA